MQFAFYKISLEVILLVAYALGNPANNLGNSKSTTTENGIKFYAYTRTTTDNPTLIQAEMESIIRSGIKSVNPLTLAIPHKKSKYNAEECSIITNTKLLIEDGNVIVADYSTFADSTKLNDSLVATTVGKAVGDMIHFLAKQYDMDLNDMHLVGFSLGAHIAGIAGQYVNQAMGRKMKRITALDPTGETFEQMADRIDGRLSADDAEFVEVIHTNAGHLGYAGPCGHSDYYPNGGSIQNGCSDSDHSCSHKRSYKLIPEMWQTIKDHEFIVSKCPSLDNMNGNSCRWITQFMGDLSSTNDLSPTSTTTSTIYYLETNEASPFGKGAYHMQFW